jgi:3-oxoadipate enol-lactonase
VTIEHQVGTVERDGASIYYEVTGSGPSLVLCHGAGGNHAIWYQQVAALADRYQVITWDHRGYGRSGGATGVGEPAVSSSDLEAVLDAVGAERTHVAAQSMGGWVALGFALAHPERVATLTLADTIAGISTPIATQNWSDYGTRLREHPRVQGLGSSFAVARGFTERDPVSAALYQAIGSLNPELDPASLGGMLTTTHTRDELAMLSCPTLFIVGDDDEIFPPAVIHDVAALIPGARVEEIAGAGHSAYFETPDAWTEVLSSFLAEHPLA